MENNKTAVDFFFDKIKSHFEHDGDLYESIVMLYSIAKLKEKEQLIYAVTKENRRCTFIANDVVKMINKTLVRSDDGDNEELFRPDEKIGEITYKQMFEI